MKDEKKRTLYLKVRVSPEEMAAIKKKFANSGMSSLSAFVRVMIFEGYIAQVNENELGIVKKCAVGEYPKSWIGRSQAAW